MTDQEPLISPGLPTAIGFDHDLDVVVVIGWSAETRSTQVVSWGSEQYREQAAQANCWLMEHWPRPHVAIAWAAVEAEYVAAVRAMRAAQQSLQRAAKDATTPTDLFAMLALADEATRLERIVDGLSAQTPGRPDDAEK